MSLSDSFSRPPDDDLVIEISDADTGAIVASYLGRPLGS